MYSVAHSLAEAKPQPHKVKSADEKSALLFGEALKLLIAIPGIKQRSAENILVEIGMVKDYVVYKIWGPTTTRN